MHTSAAGRGHTRPSAAPASGGGVIGHLSLAWHALDHPVELSGLRGLEGGGELRVHGVCESSVWGINAKQSSEMVLRSSFCPYYPIWVL